MQDKTMKLLVEYIADQHRQDRERNNKSGYDRIYVQDTNGIEDDTETFWPPTDNQSFNLEQTFFKYFAAPNKNNKPPELK